MCKKHFSKTYPFLRFLYQLSPTASSEVEIRAEFESPTITMVALLWVTPSPLSLFSSFVKFIFTFNNTEYSSRIILWL